MHSRALYDQAIALIDQGLNDTDIARRIALPRRTITEWRHGRVPGSRVTGVTKASRSDRPAWRTDRPGEPCDGCRPPVHDREAYAYLLGVYLGDGTIDLLRRGVFSLRITCDLRYPDIVDEIATCVVILKGSERVGFVRRTGCVDVSSYWKHWACLFPQHGPGRKHDRPIVLRDWQEVIVAAETRSLLRGLIHSDGSRHINTVTGRNPAKPKHYRYPRYMFTNASSDILTIFTDALDRLAIHWTRTSPRDISVALRADVAFLDTFIGPKE